jgi:hypothetical protein|tara:strand:+ start:682 stop:903 length:222 start_codon:yes stop_codon:yes gene_type:complete
MGKLVKKKTIKVNNHIFYLEIYLRLETKGVKDTAWEIFPHDTKASLYAFSNKQKLEKLIKEKHIYEPTNKSNL